jgi:hypothetical protein
MTWIDGAWIVFGVTLGILHTAGIWRSTKHPTAMSAVMGLARLLVVGLALAAAAYLGGIVPTAVGWGAGYFATVAIVMAIRRRTSQRRAVP